MPNTGDHNRKSQRDTLEGQLLLAMPTLTNPNFSRSVVFMCAHSDEGAMGLIINQRARDITFPALLEQLELERPADAPPLPHALEQMPVLLGGPVEKSRGFVLHSADYTTENTTLGIGDTWGLTATLDILKAIVSGTGPKRALLALGYAGWSPGQLEQEIQANGWLHCMADDELVFQTAAEDKYDRSLTRLGIDLSHLSGDAGHA